MTDKREIDAKIDRLKGHRVEMLGDGDTSDVFRVLGVAKSFAVNDVPHYSTSIADAWILVEEMVKASSVVRISVSSGLWDCEAWIAETGILAFSDDGAPTAPEAICQAYLDWQTRQVEEVRG